MATPVITARRRLELSQLSPVAVQKEAMGEDVDFATFVVYLSGLVQTDLESRITAATIDRTIEGASTMTVDIDDFDRTLWKSDLLHSEMDVQIDGLWFRLTMVDKSGDTITLTFQDREIEVLRTYHKWRIAQRGQMTRAQFIKSMIQEVKEFTIPMVIPELAKVQPIERYNGDLLGSETLIQKGQGIPSDVNSTALLNLRRSAAGLTVKGALATKEQISNANILLSVATQMGVSRALKVIGMMVAITETRIINEPGGAAAHNATNDQAGDDSAGIFQQRPSWGSYLDRTNVETSSRLFFNTAQKVAAANVGEPYWFIAAEIQHPREDLRTRYGDWRVEAEKWVSAFGDTSQSTDKANNQLTNLPASSTPQGTFYFYRGTIEDKRNARIRKPENTWACIQRLADEVDWRAFFISGTFYYISEKDLMKQLPAATIHEFDEGINSLDGTYDRHKKSATITITADVGRWQIPPGSVVVVEDSGVFTGRWIVNEYTRDLIGSNREATITLKKPRPQLPEPSPQGNASDIVTTWAQTSSADPTVQSSQPGSILFAGGFLPAGAKYIKKQRDQGQDFITNPGGPIIAPGDGYVLKIDINPDGFGTSYPVVKFTTGPYKNESPIYIGHTQSLLSKGKRFKTNDKLSVTGVTGQEPWNGNADQPGWCEIGFASADGIPGPFGQRTPF